MRRFFLGWILLGLGKLQIEADDGDAGAAELDLLVGAGGDERVGAEVVADDLAEGAGAGSVEDAEVFDVEHDGFVDELGDALQGFVAAAAADVDVGFEGEALLAYVFVDVGEGGGALLLAGFFRLRGRDAFEL